VTLSAQGPEIDDLLSPYTTFDLTAGLGAGTEVKASGIELNDTITWTDPDGLSGYGPVTSADVANGYIPVPYSINTPAAVGGLNYAINATYSPHPIKEEVSRGGQVIGTIYVPLITGLPTLALSPDGNTAYVALGHTGNVLKFGTSSGKQTGTLIGSNYLTVAVDNATGDVIAAKMPATWPSSGIVITSTVASSATNATFTMNDAFIGITAINGNGYVADPQAGKLIEFDLGTMQETKSVATNGSAPGPLIRTR
jgi:hypothetical protein